MASCKTYVGAPGAWGTRHMGTAGYGAGLHMVQGYVHMSSGLPPTYERVQGASVL